jgi:4-amino-4-deoxy-L-arabinose transferase-like glycosyltransferase
MYTCAIPIARRAWDRSLTSIRDRTTGHLTEAIGIAAIMLVAAFLRFRMVPSGGAWDSDQGAQMLALWTAIHTGTIPQLGPPAIVASTGTFHHGALYYDLMLPGAWLGGGDPSWVVLEIAVGSLMVVPMVWWVARSIAGPSAGLAAALLAATSGGLIWFSAFIWNPTLVEPGAALALLGAWQAWSSRRSAWLLVAAIGTAVTMQAETSAGAIVLPMCLVLIALVWRGPTGQRRRIALWGLAAVALIVATYAPFILHELRNNFAETRAMWAFATGPGQRASHGPVLRLAIVAVRTLAWPLTGWPVWGKIPNFLQALCVSGALAVGLIWRLFVTAMPRLRRTRESGADSVEPSPPSADRPATERDGIWLVAGCLGLLIVTLGLGLSNTSQIGTHLTEQYHIVADPFVLVAAGILIGALWRVGLGRRWAKVLSRVLCIVVLVAAVCNSSGQWPTGGSSWSAAQTAATRIEQDAAGQSIALVGLTGSGSLSTNTYAYPLIRDGAALVGLDRASIMVVLCDSGWIDTCGGSLEDAWVATQPDAAAYKLVDRFITGNRSLSVYTR